MATGSILDYEEAQHRLQQLEQDQAALLELVSKLRKFCDETEARMQALADREQRMDAHLAEAKEQADSYRAALVELRDAKEQLQQDFEETRVAVTESTQQLHDWVERDQSAWRDQLQQEFKAFAEQHHADLETVAKAYDHQRVVFENQKASTQALESSLENLSKSTQGELKSARAETTREIAALTDDISDKLNAMRKGAEALVQARYTSLGKDLGDRAQAASEAIDKLESDVANAKTRFRDHILVLWAALAVAAVLLVAFSIVIVNRLPMDEPSPSESDSGDIGVSQNERASALWGNSSASENAGSGDGTTTPRQRLWTHKDGRTVEAALEGMDDEHALLRKADGSFYSFPLELLSEADNEYVRSVLSRRGDPD